MAEDKKSVLLYCDLIHTVEGLTDEEAGKLFKHYLRYVNDLDPCCEDRIISLVFEPIKQQLKRDLKKWEGIKVVKSEGGALGNLKRWNVDLYKQVIEKQITIDEATSIAKDRKVSHTDNSDRTPSEGVANIAVTVTDTVTVNVKDILINNENNLSSTDSVPKKEKKVKPKYISFEESDIYNKAEFKNYFTEWPTEKCKFYFEAADGYSSQGNKYVNWGKAINGWASRDDAQNKYLWPKKSIDSNDKKMPQL